MPKDSDDAFVIGVLAGVVLTVVGMPLAAWLLLRASANARRKFHGQVEDIVDSGANAAREKLPPVVRVAVDGIAIPVVTAADGRPWRRLIREELSRRVADVLVEKMALPPVASPL